MAVLSNAHAGRQTAQTDIDTVHKCHRNDTESWQRVRRGGVQPSQGGGFVSGMGVVEALATIQTSHQVLEGPRYDGPIDEKGRRRHTFDDSTERSLLT